MARQNLSKLNRKELRALISKAESQLEKTKKAAVIEIADEARRRATAEDVDVKDVAQALLGRAQKKRPGKKIPRIPGVYKNPDTGEEFEVKSRGQLKQEIRAVYEKAYKQGKLDKLRVR